MQFLDPKYNMAPLTDEKREILQAAYAGMIAPSIKRLYEAVRKSGITTAQVSEFLKAKDTTQLYAKQRKIKNIPIDAPDDSYQADLAFYTQYQKQNSGYHVLLCIIEITSRKAFVYPLKNKERGEIIRGFEKFFTEVSRFPVRIYTDPGSEFKSKEFKAMADGIGTQHIMYQSQEHNQLGIVDRFIRTLRERIERHMDEDESRRYVSVLPQLLKEYNKSPHTALMGLTPDEVFDNETAREMIHDERAAIRADAIDTHTDIQVGDRVRLSTQRGAFTKGTKRTFGKEVYTIVATKGLKFQIKDEDGNVKERLFGRRNLLPVPQGAKTKDQKEELMIEKVNKLTRNIKKSGIVNTRAEARRLAEEAPKPKEKREVKRKEIAEDLEGLNQKTGRRYQGLERIDYRKPTMAETLAALKPKSRKKA